MNERITELNKWREFFHTVQPFDSRNNLHGVTFVGFSESDPTAAAESRNQKL
jgi:hypothetical protein